MFQFENTSYSQSEGFPVVICIDLVDYPTDNQKHTVSIILSTKDGSAKGMQMQVVNKPWWNEY